MMKLRLLIAMAMALPFVAGCSSSSSTSSGLCTAGSTHASISTSQLPNGSSISALTGANVLPLTVGSSLSGGINEPSVIVTVCDSTNTCVPISNVLLDTGSYGLRIFKSLVSSLNFTTLNGATTGHPLAECVGYADNSADWGPVVSAKVKLGSESAVTVPIQLIDSTYGDPSVCSGTLDTAPTASDVGFNGILGVGLFAQDCGYYCTPESESSGYNPAANGEYYGCNGSSCTGDSVSLADQVTNPVALESRDNNGVIVELPTISGDAASSVSGYVVLGIGTYTNNTPSGVTAFSASDSYGNFDINCNGQDYSSSFIDSGSNAIFFSDAASDLPEDSSGWYVPSSTLTLDALVTGNSGSPQTYAPLTIANFDETVGGSNYAYSNIAGDIGLSGAFDLGLPFFFGRNTYVGLESTSSSIGSGTYWAF
jgi:hypothetical protein